MVITDEAPINADDFRMRRKELLASGAGAGVAVVAPLAAGSNACFMAAADQSALWQPPGSKWT
jgi:hypothetical protein